MAIEYRRADRPEVILGPIGSNEARGKFAKYLFAARRTRAIGDNDADFWELVEVLDERRRQRETAAQRMFIRTRMREKAMNERLGDAEIAEGMAEDMKNATSTVLGGFKGWRKLCNERGHTAKGSADRVPA